MYRSTPINLKKTKKKIIKTVRGRTNTCDCGGDSPSNRKLNLNVQPDA